MLFAQFQQSNNNPILTMCLKVQQVQQKIKFDFLLDNKKMNETALGVRNIEIPAKNTKMLVN